MTRTDKYTEYNCDFLRFVHDIISSSSNELHSHARRLLILYCIILECDSRSGICSSIDAKGGGTAEELETDMPELGALAGAQAACDVVSGKGTVAAGAGVAAGEWLGVARE
jgi:hypothetical protein